MDYKTFLKYIEHLRTRNIKPGTLKGYISSLKVYFEYLVAENYRQENIIAPIHIKGVKKHLLRNLLSPDELEDLYYSYPTENGNPLTRKRNKVIIGLLVYQGITAQNLHQLEIEHVQLYKGRIEIPGSKKSNSRVLELKPWQLMELMGYIKEIHPRILQHTHRETRQLLLPLGGSNQLHNTLQKLTKELKKTHQQFISLKQLRASVIVNWLKTYNLRKVQYMAGHRYISSTERYKQDDLENLHHTIATYHPFS